MVLLHADYYLVVSFLKYESSGAGGACVEPDQADMQRTSGLEVRMDEIENHTQLYTTELENLKEENLVLQSRLEDQENRGRCSNLRIKGIPSRCPGHHDSPLPGSTTCHPC